VGQAPGLVVREQAEDLDIRPAWRRDDPELEAEAIAFWKRLDLLPAGVPPEARAKELVALAYRSGELVGVSTAAIDYHQPLRARMAFLRGATDPAHRRTRAGVTLGVGTREILERWAAEHPDERVGGLAAIVENRDIGLPLLEPIWPVTRLTLIGFTPDGRQVRAYWFRHFRLGDNSSVEAAPLPLPPDLSGIEVRKAWRRDDPEIEADAIAYWQRLGLLPPGISPEERAKEVIAAAYQDGRLVAVSTATIEYVDFLDARFALLRGSTDPEYRRSHAQLALAEPSREALEEWALAHPEERLAGGIAAVSRSEWGPFVDFPVWPESRLMLFGHMDDGRQIRARWFDHYRLASAQPGGASGPNSGS
jgi:hypothetical protein